MSWHVCAGPGTALGSSFRESFDNLSGSSQQSLQQLATRSAKLLPEGASIRDSFDKLSHSSQQALYHVVKSGVLLPSLLPHGHTAHGSSASGKSEAADMSEQLRAVEAEVRDAQVAAGSAQREVLAIRQENEMLSDLLQRSQADLLLSQGHTHELLASVSQHSDQKQALTHQNDAVQKKLAEAIKTVELCHHSGTGTLPPASAGFKGSLVSFMTVHIAPNVVDSSI